MTYEGEKQIANSEVKRCVQYHSILGYIRYSLDGASWAVLCAVFDLPLVLPIYAANFDSVEVTFHNVPAHEITIVLLKRFGFNKSELVTV